jgi:hypothetical protein
MSVSIEYKELLYKKLMEKTKSGKKTEEGKVLYIPPGFGCQLRNVAALVKDILKAIGEKDIKVRIKNNSKYKIGEVVVPLKNPNNHSYTIGEPCVVVCTDEGENAVAMRMCGYKGNDLPADKHSKDIRKATAAEIRKFVNEFEGVLILPEEE